MKEKLQEAEYETRYIIYDKECGRYNFIYKDEDGDDRDYGGIHCGEVFEFKLMMFGYLPEWK